MAKKTTTTKKTTKKAPTRRRTSSAAGAGPERSGGETPVPDRCRILSLDGGGIRGIMTAYWLSHLEKKLGGLTADHFDIVAGTSTGSILACAICKRIEAKEIVELYREKGRRIFPSAGARLWDRLGRTFTQGPSAPKYDDDGLEECLRECLGETRMGELPVSPRLLVTTYNTITREAVVFKSWREEYAHVPLWEAAKASSSAPTYFPAHVTGVLGATTPLIDGGVVANNPVACAIAEGVRLSEESTGPALRDFVVGSLGTGESTRPITVKQAREWGAMEWAVPVISVLMDGAADSASYIARQLITPGRYIRIDCPLDKAFDDMDDASATNIEALVNVAHRHLSSGDGGRCLDELAALVK